ncbi:hypothetical protein PR048_029267 [Dryococelus australis]|uniref:Uncharacterized protein n=1 Tax=Dryococelus australis TaxID=614101 RepID=A0ABQ9GCZ1_9NEOP|nr:hypothetical protein PR048_029267 [Dryococelus australis]
MKSITLPISELDFNEILQRFNLMTDEQACDSEDGGDIDADDGLPVKIASPEPASKRPRRENTLSPTALEASVSAELSTSMEVSSSRFDEDDLADENPCLLSHIALPDEDKLEEYSDEEENQNVRKMISYPFGKKMFGQSEQFLDYAANCPVCYTERAVLRNVRFGTECFVGILIIMGFNKLPSFCCIGLQIQISAMKESPK